jgi:hypothetical protein
MSKKGLIAAVRTEMLYVYEIIKGGKEARCSMEMSLIYAG